MIDRINVVKAVVHVTLPIKCSKCGVLGESEPIEVKLTHSSLQGLDNRLRKTRLGTHFPVGWGKFYHPDGDILRCPTCIHE